MSADLASRRCVPCRGDTPALSAPEAAARLAELGAGWALEGGRLVKAFPFPDFAAGLAFVNRVGAIAEAENHHPDLHLRWGRVTVRVWTHVMDGLTLNDFILAAKIETLVS